MTAMQRIQSFLKERPGKAYCDDCLSDLLAIYPRQQVEQKTKILERTPGFERRVQTCAKRGEISKLAVGVVSPLKLFCAK